MAQTVKNLAAMQETWVPSLGWEDMLEKEMATHSSILTWGIPWTEELVRLHCEPISLYTEEIIFLDHVDIIVINNTNLLKI